MTPDVVSTLTVVAAATALFLWGRLRLEVVGLLVMATLMLLGLVTPREGISGFAHEAVVTVALMLALSAGLLRTGAVDLLAAWLGRRAAGSEGRLRLAILLTVMPVSAWINNTAAVALLLPMVLGLARDSGVAPSRLLMPLSYGSQMGGSTTLIGTSTNLLVAGLVLDLGLERIGIFAITPPAALLAAAGIAYLLTVGRWLVPRRASAPEEPLRGEREYWSELTVGTGSELVGHSVADSGLEEETGLEVIAVRRSRERDLFRGRDRQLRPGDSLLVRGEQEAIASVVERHAPGLELRASAAGPGDEDQAEDDLRLADLMVSPRSRLLHRSLRDVQTTLPERVRLLALVRHGEQVEAPMEEVTLASGDLLLVRAPMEPLLSLHRSGDFALLGTVDLPERRTRKIKIAVPIAVGVVALAAAGVTTILVAALLGVLAMVLTGCIRPDELYDEMDWGVVILLGSLFSLVVAMDRSGTAALLAGALAETASPLGPYGVLAAVYLATTLLTELMTNNAAALVMTPIAVGVAGSLGLSPYPFVVAVMFGASNSFMTPIGYQTNTFIYGPGGFRFTDFARVGGPLVLLMLAVATWAIPLFFPF